MKDRQQPLCERTGGIAVPVRSRVADALQERVAEQERLPWGELAALAAEHGSAAPRSRVGIVSSGFRTPSGPKDQND